jgi:DNA-binding CsgD family transcriptional regulator
MSQSPNTTDFMQGNGILDALVQDPAVGVSVLDLSGTYRFVNQKSMEMCLGGMVEEAVGKSVHDLFPREFVDEQLSVLNKIVETQRPVLLRYIRSGKQVQSLISPIDIEESDLPCFLYITHEGEHDSEHDEFEVIESKLADLGPLDVLTRRELEVLALIKHGMTLDEIAKLLHRSRKTIDNHRTSIAKKLGESSRVRLAQIAEQAGLELRDADLQRIGTRKGE